MSVVAFPRDKGFTLIELMVTVALIAIVALVAVPAFANLIQSQRAITQSNLLLSAVALARTEAIRLNAAVRVSALTGGRAGWCVHTTDTCSDATRLQQHELPATIEVNNWENMMFDGQGRRALPAANNLHIVVRVSGCNGDRARRVTIAPIGQGSVRSWAC